MKRILVVFMIISLLISSMLISAPKAYAFTQEDSSIEYSSMARLMDLGIFSKTTPEKMDLNRQITREELAVVMVQINGQQDKTDLYKNTAMFADVSVNHWSNTFIQVAVKSGYMSSLENGKFYPTAKVDFLTVSAVIGKLLKYNDANLKGEYPNNYLTKISNEGILDGIEFTASAPVTRGQLAVIIDRLFRTRVFGTNLTFIETVSEYMTAIILENEVINPESDSRKIVTNEGIFYIRPGISTPEAGKYYYFRIKDREIKNAALADYVFQEYSINNYSTGNFNTNDGEQVILPVGIPYYYNGQKIDYEKISQVIKINSSIIIGNNEKESVYGVIFDPIQSRPEVISAKRTGFPLEIEYKGLLIDKGGKYILPSQIEVNDIVYKITDIWNRNAYIVVYNNSVSGKITGIHPNRISPISFELDGKSYNLADSFPKEKLKNTSIIQAGEAAKLILGSDGNVIDIFTESVEGTENYVLVLNTYTLNSVKSKDFGTPYYYVTVLHSSGLKETYLIEKSMLSMRGKLATYEIVAKGEDFDTVELKNIDNNITGSFTVNKQERMISDSYVANNAILFNIKNTSTPEIQASVISFNDLSSSYLIPGKVKYMHKSGDFMDIDLMLFDDVLDESEAYGLVIDKKANVMIFGSDFITSETITLLVNGQVMIYETGQETGVYIGSVAKLTMNGPKVNSIQNLITAEASSSDIQAIDISRIRVNGKVYSYHKNITVYKQTESSTWKTLSISDLKKGTDNGTITIFLDKPFGYGGKVVAILLR